MQYTIVAQHRLRLTASAMSQWGHQFFELWRHKKAVKRRFTCKNTILHLMRDFIAATGGIAYRCAWRQSLHKPFGPNPKP